MNAPQTPISIKSEPCGGGCSFTDWIVIQSRGGRINYPNQGINKALTVRSSDGSVRTENGATDALLWCCIPTHAHTDMEVKSDYNDPTSDVTVAQPNITISSRQTKEVRLPLHVSTVNLSSSSIREIVMFEYNII